MCRLFAGPLLVGWLALLQMSQAQIMSVDLGHEFFKVALMRQGVPLEIVLNTHSKRKTPTAASFHDAIRAFGDDALAHQGKSPTKVPLFFHSLLGRNFTSAADVKPGGQWWEAFGLGDKFYSYDLAYDEERGVPAFKVNGPDGNATSGEEVLASIFHFARKMAAESADGKPVRDLVVTVPPNANLRQRQSIKAAGEIAGCRVLTLVHETSACAVQRAVDFMPEKNQTETVLLYNLGSRKTEVSIVKFDSRQAGMVAGKYAPVITVLGSAVDTTIGGHLMDLKIANVMLAKFQEKHPKLAEGITTNPRALRKLLGQAQKTKAMLSANKNAPFIVESLYEDTDFSTMLSREAFEEMCMDMFLRLTDPVVAALKVANLTTADVSQVEVVGGAWRVPKVQQMLSEFVGGANEEKKVGLGQHLNGEESAALGAALVAANSSTSFRVKKIFFADVTLHEYAVQVGKRSNISEKDISVLFPVGAPLGGKKKVTFTEDEDFLIRLYEDKVLVAEYDVAGLKEIMDSKWAEYNLTASPKVSVSVTLEGSGIIEVKAPTATVEENYWVNVTKEKPKPNATNTTANGTSAGANESANDTEKADASAEGGADAGKDAEEGSTDESDKNADADASTSDASEDNKTANATNVTEEPEVEVYLKLKKKKHEKKLEISRVDFLPKPLSDAAIKEATERMEQMAQREEEVQAVAEMKNQLEASIYGCRDKLESEDNIKVSTEEQREEILKLSTELEEWMYESSTSKMDYEKRLTQLSDLLGPIQERALELESRPDVVDNVQEVLPKMKLTLANVIVNMTWVSTNKTEAAASNLAEFEEWFTKKQAQQAALPLHEAPAFSKAEVTEKIAKIAKEVEKLSKTKKPKEAAKPKDKNATKATKGEGKSEPKQDTTALPKTLAESEKALADVREQKIAAVENEDFDKAHGLKVTEQKLSDHIANLISEAESKPEPKTESEPEPKTDL